MTRENARFFWGAGVTLGLAVLYPASIWVNLGAEGLRWIQNDPAYSLFVLFVLPLAVGVFARVFRPGILLGFPKPLRYAALALLLVVESFAGYLASQEVFRFPAVPAFVLEDFREPLRLDRCLRQCIRDAAAGEGAACDSMTCPQAVATPADSGEESPGRQAVAVYRQAPGVGRFENFRDFFARANTTAYVGCFFNVAAALFVMLVFWYLVVVVLGRRGMDASLSDALTMVYGLLLLWFPARLHSEWYVNFYTLLSLGDYFAFWLLFALAIMAIPLLVYLFKPGRPVLIFSSVNGVLIAAIGLLNHFSPGLLIRVAQGLESLPFAYFLAFVLLVFIVLGTMVFTLGIHHGASERGA